MSGFRTSDALGTASAATTDGLSVPRYGLAYDLSTGQWTNAAQFQQFTRDLLPVTQQAAQQQAAQIDQARAHNLALQRAQMFEKHGVEFDVSPEEAIAYSHAGTLGKYGFEAKKAFSIIGHAIGGLGSVAANLIHGDTSLPDNAYEQYTHNGGLLTEAEFNSFSDGTKLRLLGESRTHDALKEALGAPVLHQVAQGLGAAYRGATTSADVVGNTVMAGKPYEYFDPSQWAKGWREAQSQSLGNSLVNLALDPFYSQEQLDRWKRDNPWYQMTSMGAEIGAVWYADPTVLAGKALGAAARFKTMQFPIREDSSASIALRQATQRETITVRNPLVKGYAKVQAGRIDNQWDKLKQYGQTVSAPEYAQLPMFSQRYRAVDGGAGAYALHWAANNEHVIKDVLGPRIDAFQLTRDLTMGSPNAWAMVQKLRTITPDELQRVAPGAGSLLNSLDALKTKADVLQQEVDDLLRAQEMSGHPEPYQTAFGKNAATEAQYAQWEHRWEIHTSLADKQKQLADATDMLHRYVGDDQHLGYKDWLDLVSNSNVLLSRVQAPRQRWSLFRNTPGDGDYEQRQLFMDNQFGVAHSQHTISKSLFLKRANSVEIHNLDSGLMSINRQFDQFEHLFGYAPEGARENALMRYVRAGSSDNPEYNRYKVLYDIEDTHLVNAVAQKFGVAPEIAHKIISTIDSKRTESIDAIMSGNGMVYRSAPTLMDRLSSGKDTSLSLVNHDEDAGTYTIDLMHGNHKQTFVVPDAALEKRVLPEDPTQTPNYYNPFDTRRLYIQLKHNSNMLDEINAGFVRDRTAALAEAATTAGTKFNEFWKPVQLFRLGWPFRVLMDEGARATAIFGPMYWLTGPGAESVYTAGRNVLPNVTDYIARKRKGPLGTELGPGPVADAAQQSPDQLGRAAEVADAIHIPQEQWPKIVPARAERIQQHVNTGPTPAHPMWSIRGEGGTAPTVYDAATGRVDRSGGYVVPIKTFETPSGTPEQMVAWYRQNAEILSRQGMRIVTNPDGSVTVGRMFRRGDFNKAQQFAQYATERHPDTRIWNLKDGRWNSIEDAPATPMTQASFWHDAEEVPEGIYDNATSPVGHGLHTSIPRDVAVTHGNNTYRVKDAQGRNRAVFDLDREITAEQRMQMQAATKTLPTDLAAKVQRSLMESRTWKDAYDGLDMRSQQALSSILPRTHSASVLTHSAGDRQVYVWLDPDVRVRAWNGDEGYLPLVDRFAHPASIEKPLQNQAIREQRMAVDRSRNQAAAANSDLMQQEGDVNSIGDQLNAYEAFDFAANNPVARIFSRMQQRREAGAGWKQIKSADGKTVKNIPAAFEGHSGQLFRALTASNGALDVLSEGHGHGLSLFRRRSAGYRVYNPPKATTAALDPKTPEGRRAVRYYQTYADTVNDHFGNSPIIQRMSRGESDDQIVNWLESPGSDGERVLRDVKPKDMPTEIWVDDTRKKFEYMVPSPKLRRLVGKQRLDPADFRREIPDELLPTIYGPDLEILDRRKGFGRFVSDWADSAWNYLGNVPIDAFSRHPFAQAMYNVKMKNLIASTNSDWLTPEMIDHYQKQAHAFAVNEVRRHLYNLTETTNFNDALRFIAPFWGAQYEAISKWLRIISDRPETVGRFFAAQRAVYKNFVVVDPNNNHQEVTSGTRPGGLHGLGLYHPNDMVVFQLPHWMRKKFGFGQFDLSNVGSLGIPIGSANTVLQGDLPLLPSLGPLVTIPADQFLRKVSATYGVENDQSLLYRWLFPIGRPRSKNGISQMIDQFVPGWVNRVRQASGPEDSLSRINMEMLVGREMVLRARRLGKPDPTPADIEKAANHLWHVREVSGLIQPFQVQFLPDHQYWLDAAHKFQKQYGQQWWDKFIDKYHEEAAIYATSSSNSIGVPPTDKGMEEWAKNKDLIEQYPNWTSAIISPQAYMGQFSSDAYGQQFNITLGSGDTRTLRTGSSLQDRLFNEPEIQLGWREYRKVNAAIEAELHARGLTSVQQAGAEQLALLKQAAKADIAAKYPAWARAYQQQATTINADISDLQKIAGNPIFDNRPDWQGVRQYLQIRQKVTTILDALGQQGGSRSLQAGPNQPLAQWFYNQVGQLVLSNPAFAEFYTRYLSADTLTTGSGF